jgi:hypothetical protein
VKAAFLLVSVIVVLTSGCRKKSCQDELIARLPTGLPAGTTLESCLARPDSGYVDAFDVQAVVRSAMSGVELARHWSLRTGEFSALEEEILQDFGGDETEGRMVPAPVQGAVRVGDGTLIVLKGLGGGRWRLRAKALAGLRKRAGEPTLDELRR